MRYCTGCGTEYRDETTECVDCGGPLVGQDEWEAVVSKEKERRERLRDVEMARACPVGGRIEAGRLIAALDQEGIPAFVRTFEETAFDGLFVGQKGWGEIWVARGRLDEAKPLLEALRESADSEE